MYSQYFTGTSALPERAGCSFCPWAQSFNTMANPVNPVDSLQQQGPPSGPPPDFIPTEQPTPFAVDPGAISFCLFNFTYLWLINGEQFWAYLVFVGRNSVAGWRYHSRRRRWSYFGMHLREIRSFQCF